MILHEEKKNICLTCESMKRGCERGFCGTKEEALDSKRSALQRAFMGYSVQRRPESRGSAGCSTQHALQPLAPETRAAAHQMGAAARPLDATRCSAPMGAAARPSPLLCQKTQAAARLGPKTRAAARNHAGCSARLKP